MIVLIPAFEPSAQLAAVVADIRVVLPAVDVLVVNDGSGPEFRNRFHDAIRAGATVIGYERNRGKGFALRFGIAHVLREFPGAPVITADSDGQHSACDIARVARALEASDGRTAILGSRSFTADAPLRSRFGNAIARGLFRAASGYAVSDTQTGLRGLPPAMLPWSLRIRGDRFEYELNVLLRAHAAGFAVRELPIETIYLDGNSASHFRPVRDSIRVIAPLARFALSSLAAFAVDVLLLQAFFSLTGWLVASIVLARVLSASMNFAINRRTVFQDRSASIRAALARYATLAAVILVANVVMMTVLTSIGVPLLAAKLCTEAALYAASFAAQRSVVFAATVRPKPTAMAGTAAARDRAAMTSTGRSALTASSWVTQKSDRDRCG